MHCGEYSVQVLDTIRTTLTCEEDVARFQEYIQTKIPDIDQENRVELFKLCDQIKCQHCFRRVHQELSSILDEGLDVSFVLGDVSLGVADGHGEPKAPPGFLSKLYDSVDMSTSVVPAAPRYSLVAFVQNLETLLTKAEALRSDGKDLTALETITSEQNQYISLMVDCTTEFISAVYKLEVVRAFQDVHPRVYAFVALFQVLANTLFDACQKVREKFHRTNVPSLIGIHLQGYIQRYKEDVPEKEYKNALLAVHILNIQRIHAFRSFYAIAIEQVCTIDLYYAHEMTRKSKYADQFDFALPCRDMSIKMALVTELEMSLGPIGSNHGAEFKHGRYPTVLQELAMLEIRCAKVQQGLLDVWMRTKDRAVYQLLPDHFPMTPSFNDDIQKVMSLCDKKSLSGAEYMRHMMPALSRIEAISKSDPLEAVRQRRKLRLDGLQALTDVMFATFKTSGLAAFLHDHFPVIQARVCGEYKDVKTFVNKMFIDTSTKVLMNKFLKNEQERVLSELVNTTDAPVVKKTNPRTKKSTRTSAKKSPAPTAIPVHAPAEATVAAPIEVLTVAEIDTAGENWEEVRTKKKSNVLMQRVVEGTSAVYAIKRKGCPPTTENSSTSA
jgi:hypothetical protein